MTTLVVLFNLKEGVSAADYEAWAKATDLPAVRALSSVDSFDVVRAAGLLMSDDKPPYEYVEIIKVNDMATFGGQVSTEAAQKVAAEFQGFADNPVFMLTDNIEA
ncbi:MAG: REDY-like protein HapK [Pseudomonadota bacterium]